MNTIQKKLVYLVSITGKFEHDRMVGRFDTLSAAHAAVDHHIRTHWNLATMIVRQQTPQCFIVSSPIPGNPWEANTWATYIITLQEVQL